MSDKKTDKGDEFERALSELESIVVNLEKGDLPLEQTLQQFERGIALTRNCQKALRDAEQKVEILLEKNATATPEPFDGGT